MTTGTLTSVEMGIVEQVLDMGQGYVLDFSNRTFAAFFGDLGVEIEPEVLGNSKAKRLGSFLRGSSPNEVARVLNALLEYRGERSGDDSAVALPKYKAIIGRLEGVKVPFTVSATGVDVLTLRYVQELEQKADRRLAANDLDGAITLARTLLESVLAELERRLTGEVGAYGGDLQRQFKTVAKLLRIDDKDDQVDEAFKQIARGLTQIVNGVAAIRNAASDSHARQVQPQLRHARVAVNSAKTVASFLVEVYLGRTTSGSDPHRPAGAIA